VALAALLVPVTIQILVVAEAAAEHPVVLSAGEQAFCNAALLLRQTAFRLTAVTAVTVLREQPEQLAVAEAAEAAVAVGSSLCTDH
jgi:hypothetical protein